MNTADKVLTLTSELGSRDDLAEIISNNWTRLHHLKAGIMADWSETSKFLFATDTSTTSASALPWTHTTTTPKLTQIRDNLHANYQSSLFPNDKWLTWEAHSKESAKRDKREAITSYMDNKARIGGLRKTVSDLLYDYIDRGSAFCAPTFEARYKEEEVSLERTSGFVGPKATRISPEDIVFDPTASDFNYTNKIVRSLHSIGSIHKMAKVSSDAAGWQKALDKRNSSIRTGAGLSSEDWNKAEQYSVDGFGSLSEYYKSETVEVLEFYGDIYDPYTGELREGRMITVMDRTTVVRDVQIPTYDGVAAIRMVSWRKRPGNLWGMGPLDNLVGMQYMLDHYVNMCSNAYDLKVMAPKKVIGDVEAFNWEPNATIHMDEGGDVQEMGQNFGDVESLQGWISQIESRMELYAGAPREAMGVRTPGEKTAFEVQALENAAGRIFMEKIVQFELFLEEILNDMLEISHRNMDKADVIKVLDNDIGVASFKTITKDDITGNGILRPVGARHFAHKAQELQNMVGIFNSPIGSLVAPHTSAIEMTKFISDVVDLRGYSMFSPNVAVMERQETDSLVAQSVEDNEVAASVVEEEELAQVE